jgi:hypothetical protein
MILNHMLSSNNIISHYNTIVKYLKHAFEYWLILHTQHINVLLMVLAVHSHRFPQQD